MKVVLLAAGSGAMYCGACARDAGLARSLVELGHEAVIIPLYTPMRLEDSPPAPIRDVQFGGINAYLREVSPICARLPAPMKRLLDSPAVLGWASGFAVKTKAADLGPMTVSVLQGPEGKHASAMEELAQVVAAEGPDVVVVSNSLLSSSIPALRKAGPYKVVCQVQGEDGFLDELPDPYRGQALALVRKHVAQADRLMAPSTVHAAEMAEELQTPLDRFSIVHTPAPEMVAEPFPEGPLTLGHLSSMRKAKGLDILLRAMDSLPSDRRLLAHGKVLEADFEKEIRDLATPLGDRTLLSGEASPQDKAAFFASVDVVVLPSRLSESRGRVAFEALASGRPVVAPKAGIFAELGSLTPAVINYLPNTPAALAEAILRIPDRAEAKRLGELGRAEVIRHFAPEAIGREVEALLQKLSG